MSERSVDCHAARHRPRAVPLRRRASATRRSPDEERHARAADRDCSDAARRRRMHLLVQPSGYGYDNAAMLDAMAARARPLQGHRRDRAATGTDARPRGVWPKRASSACASTS